MSHYYRHATYTLLNRSRYWILVDLLEAIVTIRSPSEQTWDSSKIIPVWLFELCKTATSLNGHSLILTKINLNFRFWNRFHKQNLETEILNLQSRRTLLLRKSYMCHNDGAVPINYSENNRRVHLIFCTTQNNYDSS